MTVRLSIFEVLDVDVEKDRQVRMEMLMGTCLQLEVVSAAKSASY